MKNGNYRYYTLLKRKWYNLNLEFDGRFVKVISLVITIILSEENQKQLIFLKYIIPLEEYFCFWFRK